jgi:hypothetical protein
MNMERESEGYRKPFFEPGQKGLSREARGEWSVGIMEYWSIGFPGLNEMFHYSITFVLIPATLTASSASRNPENTRKTGLPLSR